MTRNYPKKYIVEWAIGPIIAFRKYIFKDVLPVFGNLDERAEEVANEYYDRIGSQPAGEGYYIDMADVAEIAHERSLNWYQMMASLRQSMLNLLAAGLFHLTEQQLASLCRQAGSQIDPPHDTKLEVVRKWYAENLHLNLATLPSWSMIDELRLVANAVKHAEGSATRKLRELRPELFSNPEFEETDGVFKELRFTGRMDSVCAPLSGEEFFVSEKLLQVYSKAAESLFAEIAEHFNEHNDKPY